MKITKKQPLRPRGRSEEKRQSTKNAIRDAYINGPQKEVQIIPAKRDMEAETEKKKLRVCAYCRVSTDEDTQASSYELQVQNYTRMIQENPEWEFAGIFADEGISGTSVLHREHFLEMIEKCKAGEIDLIITKQVSRFARNVLDSLNYIFMLRKLDPPVGVYFETEKLNTLDTYLVDELQDFVDKGQMKMRPAVELSYLDEETQRDIVDRIDETEAFPSHDQAIRIRKAYEAGEIDYDKVRDIMAEEKPNQKPKFKFSFDRLKPYIPKDYSDSKAEDYVIKALEFYQKYLKKQREQAR